MPQQVAARHSQWDRATVEHSAKRSEAPKGPVTAPPVLGGIDPQFLDSQTVIALQATAGNAAVTSLLAGFGAGATLQRAPAAAAATAPPPAAANSAERHALIDQLHNDSKAAARQIRDILTGATYLGSGSQAQIMAMLRHWSQVSPPPGSRMSGMDWLIAGLRQNTYEVGVLVKQTTSAFDELHHRMSSDNVAEFQSMIATSGRQFKDEKPIELAKFEVSQEDIIRGLKAGGELAAAVATGGGSILWQIISWLANTLPGLWNTVKSVLSLIDSIKAFKAGGVGSRFNPAALGGVAISALFGELQRLPIVGGGEPPKAEESSGEASGLAKVLMMIVRGITLVKNAYNRVAGKVNSILASIDISGKEWFGKAAMVYAGITTLLEKIENPGAALKALADNLQQQIGGFFGKIKDHIGEVVNDVKTKLEFITQPAQLLAMVADKLVSTVLNFVITHPPSELVRTVFQVIQTASGKELIELVREQLKPVGDKIIKEIAESRVVQAAISPLKGPVHMIADAIGKVTEKGLAVVHEVQDKVAGYLSGDRLRELAGLGPEAPEANPPAVADAAAAAPADFLSVVKQGLHSHLMTIGMARLIAAGKALAKKGWEKVKGAAKSAYASVKGAILGEKLRYEAAGQPHEIWVEQQEGEVVVMVASEAERLEQRLDKLNKLAEADGKLSEALSKHVKTWTETIGQYLKEVKARPKNKAALTEIATAVKSIEEGVKGVKGERPYTMLDIDLSDVVDEDFGTEAENDIVKWSWGVKKRALKRASDAGKLRWSPGTDMIRDTSPQRAKNDEEWLWYEKRYNIVEVNEKYIRKSGAHKGEIGDRSVPMIRSKRKGTADLPTDDDQLSAREAQDLGFKYMLKGSLQADHPIDLIIGGSPDQGLKMIHSAVNGAAGSRIKTAGEAKKLKWGDPVFLAL